ncbi:hypothetical protein KIN34_11190 [Cellulomonas sp. DKR-3]|uniref:Uncharacterized protein n=1 Tax=Cellulomonas fulva TaxID=2835530 RepID=A0ABS5U0C5_9CELL|nr:hypothetical protein [Cellulomonas fulva]MBT0994845.1 hypothetical protein [Cellulomonas fulva]
MVFLLAIVCVVLVNLVALVRTVLRDGLDEPAPGPADWATGTTLEVPRSVRSAR